jgi:biotin operon repressor
MNVKAFKCLVSDEGDLFLSARCLSMLLGVSDTTIRKKIKAGKFEPKEVVVVERNGKNEYYLNVQYVQKLLKSSVVVDGKIFLNKNGHIKVI